MLAPAAMSRMARAGLLKVDHTPLAFMRSRPAQMIFVALAVGELLGDKLPCMPSRKNPIAFVGRILNGALSGASVGTRDEMLAAGAVLGALGAIAGTLGAGALRSRLAKACGRDFPAALLEDAAAVALMLISARELQRNKQQLAL
jgi:uncharacterized membrane protein